VQAGLWETGTWPLSAHVRAHAARDKPDEIGLAISPDFLIDTPEMGLHGLHLHSECVGDIGNAPTSTMARRTGNSVGVSSQRRAINSGGERIAGPVLQPTLFDGRRHIPQEEDRKLQRYGMAISRECLVAACN
jgi:hypothetical protein